MTGAPASGSAGSGSGPVAATGTRTNAFSVIDADGHVVEPLSAWEKIPPEHRPTIFKDQNGYEHVTVGSTEILAVPLGNLATPGSVFSDPSAFRGIDEAQPGGSDPVARLKDMDLERIDQAVLYPSIGLYAWAIPDPVAAVAVARAYNDWLASYCSADPRRLFGAAMLPVQDPHAAISELRRCVVELGFKAAFVRPNPCMGRSLSDPAYEPIWSAAEDLDIAIGIHEGSSVNIPTLASERPFNPLILHAVSHSFEQMLAYAQLCAFGTFEHHPGLRFVFLESGGSWAPFWTERLDEQAETFGGFCPAMKLKPSEYFARQCWISFEVDEPTLAALLPFAGSGRVVWGSDYPHHDATFPGAVHALNKTIASLGRKERSMVLGENARSLYKLPPRYTGAACLAQRYFAAVTAHDVDGLRTLFAPDAVLISGDTTIEGVEGIARFYSEGAFLYDDLTPDPGPLLVKGDRVDVDIDLRINGSVVGVHDTFDTDDGVIWQLEITAKS